MPRTAGGEHPAPYPTRTAGVPTPPRQRGNALAVRVFRLARRALAHPPGSVIVRSMAAIRGARYRPKDPGACANNTEDASSEGLVGYHARDEYRSERT
ncbi:hypothetical protein V5735_12795 (plasmid) [Haladaptatus sp. SPP-AMP-3]|uniref:hypothetical protein n=1 Tax=Haladaptatus sp. SPP-AMP-3 TaxID=3121295 RepID=UPI003C2F4BE8